MNQNSTSKKRRIEKFLVATMLNQILPFFAFLPEFLKNGFISVDSFMIGISFYLISNSFSSASTIMFAMNLLAAIFFIVISSNPNSKFITDFKPILSYISAAAFFLGAIDRFHRHFINCEPYFTFSS